jgi:hypothetical protein
MTNATVHERMISSDGIDAMGMTGVALAATWAEQHVLLIGRDGSASAWAY